LGERECSVQRRHQKVIEEAPSPFMTPELRKAMGEAAVKLARAGNYTNAGTVEFLVDAQRNFYFLEMNTRLQVEHPVTEMVTSLDLVKLQMRIAVGEPLPFRQEEIALRGHAVQCRIYAEDPDNNFFPSPGKIVDCRVPTGPGIRLDEGIYAGWTVPNEYDPMLGKLIAWGSDRAEALARMGRALEEYYASGIKTNVSLFRRILASADFQKGAIYTRWLDDFLNAEPDAKSADGDEEELQAEHAAAIAAFLSHTSHLGGGNASERLAYTESRWKTESRREQVNREPQA
jgi:acetyl-CoA carboxylase, biotin carboxylase subunit